MSLQFPNLKYLKLQTSFSLDCVLSIKYLLKASPNIKTLKIEIVESRLTSTHIGEWWQSELSNQCMFHHLKDVKISGVVGCVTEVKLAEVVLKKATILQRLVLRTAKSFIEKDQLIGQDVVGCPSGLSKCGSSARLSTSEPFLSDSMTGYIYATK
ncbi:hypothetical protein Sjap_008868 [Stephania japonica]|uniref:At1g61320/AtMIF1 LRR domain-containing protein n=1 Tax=Stephania japonica TaxID=461633 RepID=A0AAP0JR40_9MAGN